MVRFPRQPPAGGLLLVTAILVALVHTARAETPLEQAHNAIDSSDYPGARTALTAALESGNAGPSDLAEIYKLSGIVDAALGDSEAATSSFAKWLALEPKATLPPGTSPKILRPFSAAGDKAKKSELLKVKTETSADPPSVTLVIATDRLAMIASARVIVSADGGVEQTLEGKGKGRIVIELPKGKRLDLRVVALDAHGNRVVELGSTDVPIVIVADGAKAPPDRDTLKLLKTKTGPPLPSHPRPLYAKWWVWGTGAAVFGAVGIGFGFAARSAANDLERLNATSSRHTFSEAQGVESTARTDALLFNISMGLAGAAAIGAAILYMTEPRVVTEQRVTVVPAHGGGTFVLQGQF
jgi:hypothetical protein